MMDNRKKYKIIRRYVVQTIENEFRKVIRQAGGKAIFDLRNAGIDKEKIKIILMELFDKNRQMRRIMIIEDDENLVDISKRKR